MEVFISPLIIQQGRGVCQEYSAVSANKEGFSREDFFGARWLITIDKLLVGRYSGGTQLANLAPSLPESNILIIVKII